MNERRRKLIPVSSVFLYDGMPTIGRVVHVKCIDGLPADAIYIGLTYDHFSDVYYFCYQSAEWDIVPDYERLPTFTPKFIELHIGPFLEQAERLIETMYSSEANKWLEEYRELKKQVEWIE